MESGDVLAPITARNATVSVLVFGGYAVFLHLCAVIYVCGLSGRDVKVAFTDYFLAGHTLAGDAGWVIPLGLGTIVAANAAMLGQGFLRRTSAAISRDTTVLVALGTAGVLVAYSITACAGLLSDLIQAPRAFLIAAFTALAVVLAARTATHFWGNPEGQLQQARKDQQTATTRLRLLSRRRLRWGRFLCSAGWASPQGSPCLC